MVSTPLKTISQIGSCFQVGVNIKNIWNYHLAYNWLISPIYKWSSNPVTAIGAPPCRTVKCGNKNMGQIVKGWFLRFIGLGWWPMKPEIFWGGHSKEEIPILKLINDFPCFFMYMLHFGGQTEVSIMPHIISLSYDTVLFRLPGMTRIWIPSIGLLHECHPIYITKKVTTRKSCYFHWDVFNPFKTNKKLKSNLTVLICIGLDILWPFTNLAFNCCAKTILTLR